MTGIFFEELIAPFPSYAQGVDYIENEVAKGRLVPIKSSGLNGKRPALYQRYRKVKQKKDMAPLVAKADRLIEPPLSAAFYKKHPAQFSKDESMIVDLQHWLSIHEDPPEEVSCNERSFEIFGQEKILAQHGDRLCRNLALNPKRLAYYQTYEPLAIYSRNDEPGPLLIVENLDPFISIRRLLITQTSILGFDLQSIAYGGGYRIESYFMDLLLFGSPALLNSIDPVYYWGDLDYEGIRIFESFAARYPEVRIIPWLPGYAAMLETKRKFDIEKKTMPQYKEKQEPTTGEYFFAFFDSEFTSTVRDLWNKGQYIPQEILNHTQYKSC